MLLDIVGGGISRWIASQHLVSIGLINPDIVDIHGCREPGARVSKYDVHIRYDTINSLKSWPVDIGPIVAESQI